MIEAQEFCTYAAVPAIIMILKGEMSKKDVGGLIISSAIAAGAFGLAAKNPLLGAGVAMVSGTIFIMRQKLMNEDD